MQRYSDEAMVSIGSAKEVSIAALARTINDAAGSHGILVLDTSKPDGTPRKLLNGSRLAAMGWTPGTGLTTGIENAYSWFSPHNAKLRD